MTEFILGAAAGVVISVVVVRWILIRATARAEQQINQLVQQLKQEMSQIVTARVEEHDGMFYVYDSENNNFLAQGENISVLQERIESRIKNARVYVTQGDPDVIARLKSDA
jgi:uncharacterized protein (DUF2344 family)